MILVCAYICTYTNNTLWSLIPQDSVNSGTITLSLDYLGTKKIRPENEIKIANQLRTKNSPQIVEQGMSHLFAEN